MVVVYSVVCDFSEAIAEGRGKAQGENLRKSKINTKAVRLSSGKEEEVWATELKKGDLVVCSAGSIIPSDGEVVEGISSVDESAITGESAPVIRESGGDRSAVTGGTKVISDRIVIRITAEQGNTFLDHMISLVEGAKRQKTPNEVALTILLSGLTIIFLMAVVTLPAFSYSLKSSGLPHKLWNLTIPVYFSPGMPYPDYYWRTFKCNRNKWNGQVAAKYNCNKRKGGRKLLVM
jgi:K+-transporting ATPase ATPase B chain